jgi:hypothetical protein
MAEFVTKQPSTHGNWRVIDDSNEEQATFPRGVGTAYYKIEAGSLPTYGSNKLFSGEAVSADQFGYIQGAKPEDQPQRRTSEWEHPSPYSLDEPDGFQTRRDFWYDSQGRPIAVRQARYSNAEIPFLGLPQEDNVDFISLYKYTEGENQPTKVQKASISRTQPDKELRWSEPQPLDTLKRGILLPPKKRF